MISVIIPTRNRLDDLLLTLGRITADPYPNVEILIYDDCSDEDPRPRLAASYPQVRVLRSEKRVGPCELRNRLIAASKGDLIVGFDDDCSFETPDAFEKIVEIFAARPSLGLLSCRVRTRDGALWPAVRGEPMRETSAFISCGFAARREALLSIGGFDSSIFRAGEERDLAIRLLDAGYEIRHTNAIIADHRESPAARDHQFIHSHAFRNELLFVLKRVPAAQVPWRLARHVCGHFGFCAARGWWRAFLKGFGGFLKETPEALRARRPVALSTWRRFARLSVMPAGDEPIPGPPLDAVGAGLPRGREGLGRATG